MKRSVTGLAGGIVRRTAVIGAAVMGVAVLAGSTEANAVYRGGLIGGMSASEVVGAPYYGFDPSYPAPVYYASPGGPPPGCVIRRQRVWTGYHWISRKLRVCH